MRRAALTCLGRRVERLLLTGVASALLVVGPVAAQLSPGELHRSHSFLEGVGNCEKCHSSDRSELSVQCLECHTAIKTRQAERRGLHGQPEYDKCEHCHVEHHGRDYELIYFKGGEDAFDHNQTGYILEGAHVDVRCRKCHRSEHISEPELLAQQSVSLDQTFLGLKRDCLSCHPDRHRGQLDPECTKCHSFASWRPAEKFQHSSSGFPLTGRHVDVACDKCHPTSVDDAADIVSTYVKYRPIDHSSCLNCHRDFHKGRLGNDCSGCHAPGGWHLVKTTQFDHDRTRYPLRGRHAAVSCERCHGSGEKDRKLSYSSCTDCHSDYHDRAFSDRTKAGACEECHTIDGFRPALFTIAQHDRSDYPLRGSHRAVPCQQCHRLETGEEPAYIFNFDSKTCKACHKDPHQGGVDKWLAIDGCASCHTVDSWDRSVFDHSRTDFALNGRHQIVACKVCHKRADQLSSTLPSFAALPIRCGGCHEDVHRQQFVVNGDSLTDCTRCHTEENWSANRFDHARDSRFILDGAHRFLACKACHKTESDGEGVADLIQYKPLDISCAACHADRAQMRKDKS